MSYGSDSSLEVESEDDKEGHLSSGRYFSSVWRNRREQNNKPNWKNGYRSMVGEEVRGVLLQGVELISAHHRLHPLEMTRLTQVENFPSAGAKTSEMARHEDSKATTGNALGPLAQTPEWSTPSLKGSSPRRGCRA